MITYIAAPFGNYIKTKNTRSVLGSFTLYPREGLLLQILKTLRYKNNSWYNAIGLRNPGLRAGLLNYNKDERDILSIAALEPGDWQIFNHDIPNYVDLELNLSCPNIEHFSDYNKGIEVFLNTDRIVIAKLSPLTTSKTVQELIELGFTHFHCCNTLPTKDGGRSGKHLKTYVNRLIKIIRHFKSDATIIAGGGIYTFDDIKQYKENGADDISLGTVCFNPYKLYKILRYNDKL